MKIEYQTKIPSLFFFRYAKSVGAMYIETSAKLNRNVDTVFLELTKCIFLFSFLFLFFFLSFFTLSFFVVFFVFLFHLLSLSFFLSFFFFSFS